MNFDKKESKSNHFEEDFHFPAAALRPAALSRGSSNNLFEQDVPRCLPSSGGMSLSGPMSLSDPVYRSLQNDMIQPDYGFGIPSASRKAAPNDLSKLYPADPFASRNIASSPFLQKVAHVHPEIEPPSVPGGYLEPSHHFVSRTSAKVLFNEAETVLELLQEIDFTSTPPEYKIKCCAYRAGEARVPFVVRVFRLDSDMNGKRYAVEFQRRSGDLLYFSEIWAKSIRHFLGKGLVENGKPLPALPVRTLPKLDVEVSEEQLVSALKCLLQMASSSCSDVKSQAVQALAKMSIEDPKVQQVMIDQGCLDTFLDSLKSELEDIHRCAVSGLANLGLNREGVCHTIAQKGGVQSLCLLVSSTNVPQVLRECSRSLRVVATALGQNMVCSEVRRTVASLSCSQDAFVRQQAGQLVQLLRL